MKLNSDLNNYLNNQVKTNYKSPIVRSKSIKRSYSIDYIQNANNFKKKNYKENNKYEDKLYNNTNPYLSSRNNYTGKNNNKYNYNGFQNYYPEKINKNASPFNFYNKNTFQKIPFTRNTNKLNSLYKRKRNASVRNNEDKKVDKYFYKLICNNCYNKKIAEENLKKEPLEKKDLLNKTFNKVNPFYFQDKMSDIHNDKKKNKIKELERLQKQALDNLAKYKIANPTNVEKLQKANEYSVNPLNTYEKEDPRFIKTLNNYDKKENFINNNKDLYKIDEPRKAINDYYNKCLYQVPVLEEEYHVDPEYKKEFNKELKKQIEDNKNNKKKKKNDEINEEQIANKKLNDYIEFLKKKSKEDKQKELEEFYKRNKILDDFKKMKEKEDKKNEKKFDDEFRKKMKEEDDRVIEKKRQKKQNNINKFKKWFDDFENKKDDKKKEKEEEDNKWKNYAKDLNAKCKHGVDIYRCAICNKIFPKEKLIKYYYPSSTNASGASSKRTSHMSHMSNMSHI